MYTWLKLNFRFILLSDRNQKKKNFILFFSLKNPQINLNEKYYYFLRDYL